MGAGKRCVSFLRNLSGCVQRSSVTEPIQGRDDRQQLSKPTPFFPSPTQAGVSVLGGGEAAGPPVPPPQIDDSTYASAAQAAAAAYSQSGLAAGDIDYFSIYDCFPVCFIRGLEAVGVAAPGQGGEYVERMYRAAATAAQPGSSSGSGSSSSGGGGAAGPLAPLPPSTFPINTHGGLLGLGAPWEVPAAHGLAEAVAQLRWEANGSSAGADGTQPGGTVGEVQQGEQRRGSRQVEGARRALVYGNGGVFSASAVVILERCGEEDHGGKMGGGGAASKL
jgi:acetyl-CoA acetyltransferase